MRRSFAVVTFTALAVGAIPIVGAADHDRDDREHHERVYVERHPPEPVYERRYEAPSHRHVWIAGHHRWNGREYVWVPGRYEVPPEHYRHWVSGHWAHEHRGWYWVEGHWS